MSQGTFEDIHFKAMNGQFNIDEAQGIVECFVAAVGNKDSVGDIVASGAFTESLKRRKPRVVWGHNWNDPIGKVLEIYEVPAHDPRLPGKMKQAGVGGLYAKVQFNLATEKGREAFASVAFFGGDQEWSIGYKTLQANFDSAMQANVLREVELYEVSPVLHGANQLTATISVKSDEGEKCHTPAMGAGRPMIPAVMRAFNPGPAEVNPLRILERISEDISNPREDIFAEGEARVLNPEEKYRLEQELMERSNNRLKIISATENMVTFHRLLPNGTSTAYRLPYHYDNGTRQYMFGKPEKMGQGPDQPQPQAVVPMQMPSMPMSVKPNVVSPYTMVNGEYAGEKSIEEKLHEVISGLKLPIFDDEVAEKSQQEKIEEVVGLLQSYIEEKSEPMRVVMKCEPHQAFYVKQLLDPVIEYHGLEAQVSEKGVHLSGTFSDEVLDALYVSEKSIQRMFMKEGGWGKGDGPSGPTFQVEVKALGGRVGQRIGGGLSAAPPGMVWVDVTGAIDGDSDGIVFEGTPMQRPIIPRAMIPKAQAGILQGASLPRAMQIERDRDNAGSLSKRNNEDGGKKRKFRPRLSAEEVRISQEQKLRSNKIPKKRKPGPSADEWRPDNSRSRRNVRPDNNLETYDPWKNRDSGTERLLGNEFSILPSNDNAIDDLISSSRSKKFTAKEIADNLAYFNMYNGLDNEQVMNILKNNNLFNTSLDNSVKKQMNQIIAKGGKIIFVDNHLVFNLGGNKIIFNLSDKIEVLDKELGNLISKSPKVLMDLGDLGAKLDYIKPALKRIQAMYGDSFIIRILSGGHYYAVLINPNTGEDLVSYGFSGSPRNATQMENHLISDFTKPSMVSKFNSLLNFEPILETKKDFPLRRTYPGETPKFGPLVGDSELLQVYTGMELPSTSMQYPNGLAEIEIHDIGEDKFGIFGVIISEDGVEHLISQEMDGLADALDFARSLGAQYSFSQLKEFREAFNRRFGIVDRLDNPSATTSEVQEMIRARNDRTFGEWHVDSSRSQRKPTLAYNTAAKSIREIFADEATWEPFFEDLNEVLRHSQNESQRLLDLYDDPNATEEAIDSLEQSIRDLDEQIAAVIDYAKMLNGENRRARLKKLAIPLVQKMIDEREGTDYGDFTDEEIDLLRDRLTYTDQLIQDIFGEEGSDKSRKFVESMQETLDDAEWYDSTLTSPIEDEDNRDYLESPSRELYDEVAKSIEIEVGYIKDARKRNHQKRLAVSDGNNFTDNNSRSKRSFSNGRGVGESRQVFPSDDIKTSNKIKYARYDGRKQELLVEYSSGQTTTYGGITENMVSTLEKSTDSIDNAINAIKNDARYSIKANGEIEGRATSIATFVNRDIERLASYGMLTAKDRTMMQLAANAIASDFAEPPEHELLTLSDYLTGIANELIRKYEENSAALNLLEIKDAIDDRIGNGLGGKRGTRMYRPLQKETTLDLTSDEIGELRDEIQAILNKHGDRMTFAPFAEFDKALKDAQDGNKNSVTIQDNLHLALTVAYDELYWMALNNQAEKRWLNPIGEAPLNLAAASGRFSSPRLKANRGDFNGVPFNNGAPSRMTPEARTALIDWANGDGSGLQVLRGIRDSYRTRNGNLTPRQWNTLASMYRRFGPGGSESTSKSKKDTEIYYSIVPSDIPEQLDDAVDGEAAETPKPSKPKGKPAAELLPDDFDSMTAKEKIDVMFQIGLATKDNPNGIMQEDWNRLIYPLDKELDVEEAVRNQAEFVAAQEAAAIRGEMLTEEEFYEQKSRQAELNDRRTIRHALSEYDAGRPELLAKLGLRRENFIVKADREFKAPTKPKPLGKWALDFSMKIRTQIEKASSNGLAGDEHLDPWLSMEDLINDNDGLLDEETIQKIIPVLEEYVSAYDGAEFGHRSEGNSYKQAQDMIEELENTLTILLDPTIIDDDADDGGDDNKDGATSSTQESVVEPAINQTDTGDSSRSKRQVIKLEDLLEIDKREQSEDMGEPFVELSKALKDWLNNHISDMGGWNKEQESRLRRQVDDLILNLRGMRDKWQSIGTTERRGILRRMKTVDGYEPHPLTEMSFEDIIKNAELRIHDDGTLSFKLPPNPILRKLIPGDRNYHDVEIPDGETIRSILDIPKGKLDTRQWDKLFDSIYRRVDSMAELAVFPNSGEELPHHSLYLPSYIRGFRTRFPGVSDAIQYRYNDIAARILQHYVGPELEKVKRNENPKIGEVVSGNDYYIHGYLALMADPHAWREVNAELDDRFVVPPSVILHDVLGHYTLGNTFDRNGEWGNILATIALARDKEFWEKLRQIPELADLTDEDREIYMRGLLHDVAAPWLHRVGYPEGNGNLLDDIKTTVNFYDGPIDELLDKLDPPSEQSSSSSRSTRRIPFVDMSDEQLSELGKQSIDGIAIRGKLVRPSSGNDSYSKDDLRLIIEPGNRRYPQRTPGFNDIDPSVIEYFKKIKYDLDKDKDKDNSEKLSDLLFPGDGVVLPSRIPSNPDKYKDLTDEELISKAVGFESDGDYPSDAFIHELSLRGYEVWKRRVIGKKSYGGGWVEDFDSFSVRPVVSPTQEHLDRRKSLYSPTEDVVDANEPTTPNDLPTLEVEEGTPKDTPSKPKTPKRPRSQEGPTTNQTGTNNINIGGDNSGDINIVNEGVTTTVVNGRNVVIDVDGDIADKPLNEVDKELADIQEQLAELKNRRVGGSISDKEYAQRRVDLANKKIALKLRKYAVPNGDATKGAPTVSYSGSSSRSTRKIDYYRQEFNLSPEDLEFIKYTNADNEYLRNEFGIDDIAIEDIRSYVPPLDVVENLDSLTDDDVNFLSAYDEKINELTERRNTFLLDVTKQYFLITNKIKQSNLSDENKKSQIKEITDSFTEMMEQENQSHLDSLKKVVLYSAPLGRNGAGWKMTSERIASLGLPADYEDMLDREKDRIVRRILGESNVDAVMEFTGLDKSDIDAIIERAITRWFPGIRDNPPTTPGDGSSSRSKRETYRPLLGHTFEDYGQAEKKLSYSLEKLSKQNGAAKKLNDEEKNVIKKYFQIKYSEEPLRLLSDDEIKTLLNLISEEKLTVRNADLSAELLSAYRKDAESLLIRELDIRSNPQEYKFGGNERKLKNRFLSAKELVDPETMGQWETQSLRAAWLYPDGRLYHVTDGHTKEHTYHDAFGDGLIRLNVSLGKEKDDRGRASRPFLAMHAADTAPTVEQIKTLEELIDVAKPEEIFYQAGVSSKIHSPNEVIPDDSDFGIYVEGERSGTLKSGDLKKKLKQELDAVGWTKLPDSDSSSRSKKDDGPDSDLSDEEFEIIDDFVNADIDNIEPVEEEPTDGRTRRARAKKREEFLKDAIAQIIKLSENAEKFGRGPDSGEVVGNLLERVAKMFATGNYSIIDEYEEIIKRKGIDVSAGKFFASSYYKYASSSAETKLQRQKGGNLGKGKFVENIEAIEKRATDGEGSFVLPALAREDDLSVGEIDEDVAKKIAFYDKFEEYLPLHAEIMGYIGSGLTASKISQQTGIPLRVVNQIKSNITFIAKNLGDIENWPLDSLDEDYREIAKLLPGDDMSLNLDIAKRLKKAKTFFETMEFDRNTGEINFDVRRRPNWATSEFSAYSQKIDEDILSLFKDIENPPTRDELMKLTGLSADAVYTRLTALRENTGRELSLATEDKRINNAILSFFKDGKESPDINEIMKATGLSVGAIKGRLITLRKETGRKLVPTFMSELSLQRKNDIVLSFFEEGKPTPLLKDIADALGVTEGSARGYVNRLRKKTGKKLNVLFVKKETTTTGKSFPKSQNDLKIKNQKILSLFEDSKVAPSIQDIMDATGLKRSGAYRRLEELRKITGQELILDKKPKSPIARAEEINKTILSLFKNGEQAPSIEEISKATGLRPGTVRNRLMELRKSSGRKLIVKYKKDKKPKLVVERKPGDTSKEEEKTPDELVLSLFKNSKTPPTMQEIVRELEVSYPAAKERLKRLRQKTGMALSITPESATRSLLDDDINQQLLSLFKNNENITTEQIAKATGLSVSAIKGRLVRLRKETGKELSVSRDLPPSLRDDISKTILSFFKEGKSAPTRQQLVDATGLSADGVTRRLQKLRKGTGMDLQLAATKIPEGRTTKPKLEIILPKEK